VTNGMTRKPTATDDRIRCVWAGWFYDQMRRRSASPLSSVAASARLTVPSEAWSGHQLTAVANGLTRRGGRGEPGAVESPAVQHRASELARKAREEGVAGADGRVGCPCSRPTQDPESVAKTAHAPRARSRRRPAEVSARRRSPTLTVINDQTGELMNGGLGAYVRLSRTIGPNGAECATQLLARR
jgi:hypothetical protein